MKLIFLYWFAKLLKMHLSFLIILLVLNRDGFLVPEKSEVKYFYV